MSSGTGIYEWGNLDDSKAVFDLSLSFCSRLGLPPDEFVEGVGRVSELLVQMLNDGRTIDRGTPEEMNLVRATTPFVVALVLNMISDKIKELVRLRDAVGRSDVVN